MKLGLKRGTVKLEPHDRRWRQEAEKTIGILKKVLEEHGIYFRGSDVDGQQLYVMGDFEKDTRTHHIHVVIWNGKEWNDYVNFRDFLNCNADMASRYQSLKESLESQYVNDRNAYTKGKQEMIDSILEQARQWRGSERNKYKSVKDLTVKEIVK